MTKALFYHPSIENIPLLTVPLAFLHLATALQGGPHEIELVDGRREKDPIAAVLDRVHGADMMLVSTMPGSQIASALAVCEAVKTAVPDLPIFWGGPHPSVDWEGTIASPVVSGVVVGRGEFTISDLLDSYCDHERLAQVPNLLFKNDRNEIIRTKRISFSDRKPQPPDFDLLADVEPYICQTRRSKRMLDYISSFGCPHRCTFCSEPVTSGSHWSCLDADVLVREVQSLISRYGIDGILFQDAKFVTDRKRLVKFCTGLIESNTKINWIATACGTDIFPLHDNGILKLMQQSGCEQLFIGAEAASAETLSKYFKTVEGEATYRMARLLWEEYDILPHFSYVISYPIEDMDQVKKTLHLHQSICEIVKAPTGELGIYNPVAQTGFFQQYQHHFHVPETLSDWSRFSYFSQNMYKTPSSELQKVLFQHHIKIRRMFPNVESYKTFDVWQEQYQAQPA